MSDETRSINFTDYADANPIPKSDLPSVEMKRLNGVGPIKYRFDDRCAHLGPVSLDMETRMVICCQCNKHLDPFGYLTECLSPLAEKLRADLHHYREYEKNLKVRKGHRQKTCAHTKADWLYAFHHATPDGFSYRTKHCPTCGLDLEQVFVKRGDDPEDSNAETREVPP